MSHLFWLDQEHLKRIQHIFSKPHGVARSDDRTVLSGIIHLICNGMQWRDATAEYGPHKTLYNRFVRWSRLGVFARIFRELAEPGSEGETIMIDSTRLKAHRTAASLSKGGPGHGLSVEPKAASRLPSQCVFFVLTVARTIEVRFAVPAEIEDDVWMLDPKPTKTATLHRVPLSSEAQRVIGTQPILAGSEFLFPSPRGKAMSDATMSRLMEREEMEARPHGFRATFRTWVEEMTDKVSRSSSVRFPEY